MSHFTCFCLKMVLVPNFQSSISLSPTNFEIVWNYPTWLPCMYKHAEDMRLRTSKCGKSCKLSEYMCWDLVETLGHQKPMEKGGVYPRNMGYILKHVGCRFDVSWRLQYIRQRPKKQATALEGPYKAICISTVPFSIEPFRFNCCRFICFNCLRLVRRFGFIFLLNFGIYFHRNPGFSATLSRSRHGWIRSLPISKGGGPIRSNRWWPEETFHFSWCWTVHN